MKLFYRIIIISSTTIFSAFFLIVVLLAVYLTYKIPFNNYHLMVFQKDFERSIVKFHPAESKLLAGVAEVGNWADGTYCEFLVGQFRSSLLPKEELEKNYPYDFFSAGVYFIDENEALGSPWLEWRKKYLKDYKPKDNEIVYLVWKSKYDNSTNGDIRCD